MTTFTLTNSTRSNRMVPLEAVINSLDEAILVFDRFCRVIHFNRAAEELLGRSAREIEQRHVDDLFGDAGNIPLLLRKTLEEGRSVNSRELETNVGRPITVDITISPLYHEHGLEGAILTLREHLAIPSREDDQFDSLLYMLGSLAHEIKNPLSGIKGAAQLLQSQTVGAETAECAGLILKEVDRLNSVLQSYLTMTRKPVFNQLNIHEIIEHALKVLGPVILEKHVLTAKSYDPSLPYVNGDESKLLQVFINLIKNAIEAMEGTRRKRTLTIVTRPSDSYVVIREHAEASRRSPGAIKQRWVVITVQDTGPGVPSGAAARIFMPYYTSKRGGSGLGLSLSKKIIKDHGGTIKVKSEEGRGATFSIYLPYTGASAGMKEN
ncbi:MAG: two-component system sensor histidine kinase NtrB [Chloroflexota bacterium]